jgi:hypothetical protein
MFWWPALRGEVDRYVRNCPVCQFNKASNQKPAGPLQPLPIPESPWDNVSFDFSTGLPKTERGFDSIVVFVDRLTKFAYIYPCHKTITAEGFADIRYEVVYRNERISRVFVSDRDPKFWRNFGRKRASCLARNSHGRLLFTPRQMGRLSVLTEH